MKSKLKTTELSIVGAKKSEKNRHTKIFFPLALSQILMLRTRLLTQIEFLLQLHAQKKRRQM